VILSYLTSLSQLKKELLLVLPIKLHAMLKLLTPILVLAFFTFGAVGQTIQTVLIDEDFDVFLSENVSVVVDYQSDFPFDTLQYAWRQTSAFDHEGSPMHQCSVNGTPFMQAGNQQLASDWQSGGVYSTSLIISDIQVEQFDSLLMSFEYVMFDLADYANFSVSFSNNGGLSWNETANFQGVVLSQNCDPVLPTVLDVSSIQGQTVSLRLTFAGWRWIGLDNVQIIGYQSDSPNILGCTYELACNFNPEANIDDGSCEFIGSACDDNDPNTMNDSLNSDCLCEGEVDSIVLGCIDAEACNYNENATQDDGSCEYLSLFFIAGNLSPVLFETQTYTYELTAGSSYEWSCDGGAIQSGNGTNEIEVVWAESGVGEVCVVETNDGCQGQEVCAQVAIVPVGVDEIGFYSLKLYPNPVRGDFVIETNQFFEGSYSVLDSQGRVVASGLIETNKTMVSSKGLTSGYYFLHLTNSESRIVKRLVIQD
jgi:hypothetical protein